MKKVVITGATGFTGVHVVSEFVNNGYEVTSYVRDIQKAIQLGLDRTTRLCCGSIEQGELLQDALNGTDVLVNVVSLGFGHAPLIVDACQKAGLKRAVFISTTGIFTRLNPVSKQMRLDAERVIKESRLNYTILRPTMIFGTGKDRNVSRLIKYIKKYPILPIPGSGKNLIQPVYVKDLANAIYRAANSEKAEEREYNISGSEAVSFNTLVESIAELLGKRIVKIPIPLAMGTVPLVFFEKIGVKLPIKSEQLLRLNEDKAFSYANAQEDFGYAPILIKAALQKEIIDIQTVS